MRWQKGIAFKAMPPLAMIQSITVEYTKGFRTMGSMITLHQYAEMRRSNQPVAKGYYCFFMDFETRPTGLHIYPTPDKQITVRVRYLPKVVEI